MIIFRGWVDAGSGSIIPPNGSVQVTFSDVIDPSGIYERGGGYVIPPVGTYRLICYGSGTGPVDGDGTLTAVSLESDHGDWNYVQFIRTDLSGNWSFYVDIIMEWIRGDGGEVLLPFLSNGSGTGNMGITNFTLMLVQMDTNTSKIADDKFIMNTILNNNVGSRAASADQWLNSAVQAIS